MTCPWAHADTSGNRLAPWRVERDVLRFQTVATDPVMELLAIRPGMTILDVGAGTGQFAYEFARRLNGTGRVYATDANESCVDYMKKEAARRGLGNLEPVLVKRDGVDPFYGKFRFDLVTLFHVLMRHEDQVGFFRELRSSLTEDGRFILILYKTPTRFSPGDITGDLRDLIGELSRERAESPYSMILKDSTRKRIREHPEADPSPEVRDAIVGDFNDILSNVRFTARFSEGSAYRKELDWLPEERGYADWVLAPYRDAARAVVTKWDVKPQGGPENEYRWFQTINKLLVIQRYRKYLRRDGLFASGFTPSVRSAFEKAGFRLEKVYSDLIPFEDLIVFTPR